MDHRHTKLTLHDGSALEFPYNGENNLPLMLLDSHFATHDLHKSDLDIHVIKSLSDPSLALHVCDETNQNITQAQKELLLWHHKFAHCDMQRIQRLFRSTDEEPAVIPTKHATASSCDRPICAACQFGKQHRTSVP